MQKVERRKHRDRKHGRLTALLLCALLLAGCAAAVLFLRRGAEEGPQEQHRRITGAITRRAPYELMNLTVTPRDGEPWTVYRDRESGELKLQPDHPGEEAWTVDETVGDMLRDAAVNLTYEDVFTENRGDWEPHAEDFGLKDPLITADIRFTDGLGVTVHIGDSADPDGNAYYYMTVDGNDRLFAVSSGTVQDFSVEKTLLHPVEQLEIRNVLLDRITVRDARGEIRTEWRLNGLITDQDAAENWILTAPFVYPADYEALKNLRESAENLRLGAYVGDADEETLKACGLDTPAALIELHMATGATGTVGLTGVYDVTEWPERTEELILGSPKTDMVDYIRFGDKVYTISHFSVSAFTETDPMSTAARYPVQTPLNSLESVMVEKEGEEPVHYALLRLDITDTENGSAAGMEGDTLVRCLRNGKEIPYDAFAASYERLLTVTVSGKLPEERQRKPAHTKYTFRTVSGGTHTVELSDYDGMHDAVAMDGHTLFYLIKGGMTDLP